MALGLEFQKPFPEARTTGESFVCGVLSFKSSSAKREIMTIAGRYPQSTNPKYETHRSVEWFVLILHSKWKTDPYRTLLHEGHEARAVPKTIFSLCVWVISELHGFASSPIPKMPFKCKQAFQRRKKFCNLQSFLYLAFQIRGTEPALGGFLWWTRQLQNSLSWCLATWGKKA